MVVREGANVNLRCVAKGSPEPSITWRREGGESIRLFTGEEGELLVLYLPIPYSISIPLCFGLVYMQNEFIVQVMFIWLF